MSGRTREVLTTHGVRTWPCSWLASFPVRQSTIFTVWSPLGEQGRERKRRRRFRRQELDPSNAESRAAACRGAADDGREGARAEPRYR